MPLIMHKETYGAVFNAARISIMGVIRMRIVSLAFT